MSDDPMATDEIVWMIWRLTITVMVVFLMWSRNHGD